MFSFEISVPDRLRDKAIDAFVDTLSSKAENLPGGDRFVSLLQHLRSDSEFKKQFSKVLKETSEKFVHEYLLIDKEIAEAIAKSNFFADESLQEVLVIILKNPDRFLETEHSAVLDHFSAHFPQHIEIERIDAAINNLLKKLAEAVWLMPEFRDIYGLVFQKMTAEGVSEHVRLAKAQTSLSIEIRDALSQLTATLQNNLQLTGKSPPLLLTNTEKTVSSKLTEQTTTNWGEAPSVPFFYSREREVEMLSSWCIKENCRFVGVFGMGGIGKTALVVKLAKSIASNFSFVYWVSLRNAPLLSDTLHNCIQVFSAYEVVERFDALNEGIAELISWLKINRCLLILDNYEAVLEQSRVGYYQQNYEDYGTLLYQLINSDHTSCVIITSREKPKEIGAMESESGPIRSLKLNGISAADSQEMLNNKRLKGSLNTWSNLVNHYSGNPLALNIVSEMIREVYDGRVEDFLADRVSLFGQIQDLLSEQYNRLSDLEKSIILWLAIEREPVSRSILKSNLIPPSPTKELMLSLQSLRRRFLVEQTEQGFTLQNVIMEFATEHLVSQFASEIESTKPVSLLNTHALLKAQARDHVRQSQSRLIMNALISRLHSSSRDRESIISRLIELLEEHRKEPSSYPGYLGGNALNLLLFLKHDVRGMDFSNISVLQAYLQGADLQEVNFEKSDLTGSVFTTPMSLITSVKFAPQDQALAASTAKGEIHTWDIHSQTPLATYKGHSDWVTSVSFSSNGDFLVSGSRDHSVKVWDVHTSLCIKTFTGHSNWVNSVIFTPDDRFVISGSEDKTIKIWEIATGACTQTFTGHEHRVRSIALNPSGTLIASCSGDWTIKLWDINQGSCAKTLIGHQNLVVSVAFSHDGRKLVSGSEDQTVKIWDLDTGQCLKTLRGHTDSVWPVCFNSDDSLLVSAGGDKTIRLWDVKTGNCLKVFQGHTNWIHSVSFSQSGKLLASGGSDQVIKLWNVETGQCIKTWQGYIHRIWSLAFSPQGNILATGGNDQTIKLWDVENGKCLKVLRGHTNQIWSVSFSPDGQTLASCGDDHTVKLWSIANGICIKTLDGHTHRVRSVAFAPNNEVIASGSEDQTIRLWDIKTGVCLKILYEHNHRVWTLAFSPDSKLLASGSNDHSIKIWDVRSGNCLKTLYGHTHRIWSLAFCPTRNLVASGGGDRTVKIWNIESGECLDTLWTYDDWVWSVAFSSDGNTLASGSNKIIHLWDMESFRQIIALHGHKHRVRSITFSPNNSIMASSSDDEAVILWDITNGTIVKNLRADRPYEKMNIALATGLTNEQKSMLFELGAVQ